MAYDPRPDTSATRPDPFVQLEECKKVVDGLRAKIAELQKYKEDLEASIRDAHQFIEGGK